MDKQKLFTLNFSATQEIDKIQQSEKAKLEAAELELMTLTTENTALKKQVLDLEHKFQQMQTTQTNLITRLEALENK